MSRLAYGSLNPEQSRRALGLLSELLLVSQSAYSGTLKLLNLAPIEAEFVRRYGPKGVERMSAVAAAALGKLVQDPSLFFQKAPNAFVMILVNQSKHDATQICEKARRLIIETLKLEHNISQVDLQVLVENMTFDSLRKNPNQWLPSYVPNAELDRKEARQLLRHKVAIEAVDVTFRPVWDAKVGAINSYITSLRQEMPSGTVNYGYSAYDGVTNLKTISYLDEKMLSQSINTILKGLQKDEDFTLITPIYYPAYRNPFHAPLYHATLGTIPPEAARRLVLHLIGAEKFNPRHALDWDIRQLSNLCRGVILQSQLDAYQMFEMKDLRINGIGMSLWDEKKDGARLRADLQAFRASTRGLKCPRFVTGVSTRDVAKAAYSGGYRYLTGSFIGEETRKPNGIRFMSFEEISAAQKSPKRMGARKVPEDVRDDGVGADA